MEFLLLCFIATTWDGFGDWRDFALCFKWGVTFSEYCILSSSLLPISESVSISGVS